MGMNDAMVGGGLLDDTTITLLYLTPLEDLE